MTSKIHFPGRCLWLAALLLAGLLIEAQAAGPARTLFPGSIKVVEEALPVGPQDPHRPYISRHTLKAEEAAATMQFEVVLKMRNFDELEARVAKGQLISLQEMAAKYEPLPADYQAAVDWLTGEGLTITRRDRRNMVIFVRGTVSQIQQALQVNFARVMLGGKEYTSAVTVPSMPATIASRLLGINGLQPHIRAHRHSLKPDGGLGSGGYTPAQIAQGYQANGLYGMDITGAGQAIAIVIDIFPSSDDLISFWQLNHINQTIDNISFIQVVPVPANPAAPSGEETLDVEWSSSIAPGAKVRVYGTTDLAENDLEAAYVQIYDDVIDHPEYGIHQMSMSYGQGETYTTQSQVVADDQDFATLVAAGVTIFASSGDQGSTPGPLGNSQGYPDESGPLQVDSPASDPNVTGVGGTTLTLNASNNESNETVWNNSTGASGGGASMFTEANGYWNRPTWQTGKGVPAGTTRLVPDISCAADPDAGAAVFDEGSASVEGGTSWSSPTCAGFCALINQARASAGLSPVGLLGPQIYSLLSTTNYPANYATNFRDITVGNNATGLSGGLYKATAGYDEATGIGVPLVQPLAEYLVGSSTLTGVYQQPVMQSVAPGFSATFTVFASGSPVSYQWQRLPAAAAGTTNWVSVSDNGVYSISSSLNSSSLTVSNATSAMSGDQFQCVVTYPGATTLTSAPSSTLAVETPMAITTLAGNPAKYGLVNGTGTAAEFDYPTGVARDSSGNLYISDLFNSQIRKVTSKGVVTTPFSFASLSGTFEPRDIAIDSSNNLFVSDEGSNRILEINTSSGQVSTFSASTQFGGLKGIAVDGSENVYVTDYVNNVIWKVASGGTVTLVAGQIGVAGSANGAATTQAQFNGPIGLAVDASDNLYVADYNDSLVRKITPGPASMVTTVAGQANVSGYQDGPAVQALFNVPRGVAVDSAGNLYVSDSFAPTATATSTGNNVIRKITPAGIVTTLAGLPGVNGSVNGIGTVAEFYSPTGVKVDSSGNIYVADAENDTIRVGVVEPEVTVTATQPNAVAATSGGTPGQFTVSRTGSTTASLTVDVSVAGTAVSGTDYTALSGSVTIPVGVNSVTIPVNPLVDSQATTSRTVQLSLTGSIAGVLLNPTPATVSISQLTPYQAWQLQEFGANANDPGIAGDLADPNNNGVPNLLEYAFNSNPLQTGSEPLPAVSIVSGTGGNTYLAITYIQINNDPSLTYTVQVTSDLTQQTDQWHSGPSYTTVVSQQVSGNTTQVTVRDNIPISQATKRFIRVEVTGP